MNRVNAMSTQSPWTLVSRDYATGSKPFFEQYCLQALRISGYDGKGKVLDMACGPGTMSLLIHNSAEDIQAIDFSEGMLDCFSEEIKKYSIQNITVHLMDGQDLLFEDNRFDWAFSTFGLMFFKDRLLGFREMYRTLKPGGRATVTSWASVSESSLMQMIFGAVGAAFSKEQEADSSRLLNLEDPDCFRHEMEQAGFANVAITHFDGCWAVNNVKEFFDWMVKGSAPIVLLKNELGEKKWTQKRAIMLEWLKEQIPEVPTTLYSRAYIGSGQKQ